MITWIIMFIELIYAFVKHTDTKKVQVHQIVLLVLVSIAIIAYILWCIRLIAISSDWTIQAIVSVFALQETAFSGLIAWISDVVNKRYDSNGNGIDDDLEPKV